MSSSLIWAGHGWSMERAPCLPPHLLPRRGPADATNRTTSIWMGASASVPDRRHLAVVWDSLGAVGQFTLFLLVFMSVTLAVSIFSARERKKRRKGKSYMAFMMRDSRKKSGDKKKKKRKVKGNKDLEEAMLDDSKSRRSFRSSRSRSKSVSRSRSKSRSAAREGGELDDKSMTRSRSKSAKSRSKSRRPSSTRVKEEEENATSTHRQHLV